MISDEKVLEIRATEGPDGLIREALIDAGPKFPRGRRVRLLPRARLAGNKGSIVTFQERTSEERCSVLLRLLGREVSLVVREDDLVAI
jgi:hypothetical protein